MGKILISHRGNINGRIPEKENSPEYIIDAINQGYDVEIDIRYVDGELILGHDDSQYPITLEWLTKYEDRLWVHCKNIQAIEFFTMEPNNLNYFWHQEDTLTLTSKSYVWAFPGKQPIKNSIAVVPELFNDDVSESIGVCSDYILKYKIYE